MGGQDGIVYEMIPTAADRQKSQGGAKCRKVKQQGWCRQALSYLPAFVQGEKEAIIDLAFAPDENESCEGFLYALVRTVPVRQAVAEKDSVRVFKVNPRDNQSFGPESMLYVLSNPFRSGGFFEVNSSTAMGCYVRRDVLSGSVASDL